MPTDLKNRSLFNVVDYGAAGDGAAYDAPAIQAAINACGAAGGGTVYVPAGNYIIGSLFLRSHSTLQLDAGATLLGSEDLAHYPIIEGRWEGRERETYAPLITGSDLDQIAVTGRGTIDGQGAPWWKLHRSKALAYPRPRLLSFARCTNVLIRGVTLTNSPSWTINPVNCDNVTIDQVTIHNPPDSPNTDGINPDSCRHVHISNCHVDVGDDCITLKSGVEAAGRANLAPCENITITNCTMLHGHGGVVIGSEMSGGVKNVVISNCVFVGTDRGLRLKSRRGRGGVVEDIRAMNIVMQDVVCPFTMNLYYHIGVKGNADIADKRPRPVSEETPAFRHIHFSHITARNAQYAAGFIYGLPERPLEDISFDDISISMAPEAQPGLPEMADGIEPMQRAGLWVCNVERLSMHNVEVAGQMGPAFSLAGAREVEISGCKTPTPEIGAPVIAMSHVTGAWVRNCRASAGTGTFLQVTGDETSDIVLSGNDLTRAGTPVQLGANTRPDAVRTL